MGTQAVAASGKVVAHKLQMSMDGCAAGNSSFVEPNYPDESNIFPIYRLSFHWITPIGIFTVFLVGSLVSYFTKPRDVKKIDPELISPVLHRFLPSECFTNYGMTKKSRNFVPRSQHELNSVVYEDSID